MLRYLVGSTLCEAPRLSKSMFQDRNSQFCNRLGWDLSTDALGQEIDEYDTESAIYCIYEKDDGTHGGSGRLISMKRRNMISDFFPRLREKIDISKNNYFESTRFCISPRNTEIRAETAGISNALMFGGWTIANHMKIDGYFALFYPRMLRVYRMAGWSPEIIAQQGSGQQSICLGFWSVTQKARISIIHRMHPSIRAKIQPKDIEIPSFCQVRNNSFSIFDSENRESVAV